MILNRQILRAVACFSISQARSTPGAPPTSTPRSGGTGVLISGTRGITLPSSTQPSSGPDDSLPTSCLTVTTTTVYESSTRLFISVILETSIAATVDGDVYFSFGLPFAVSTISVGSTFTLPATTITPTATPVSFNPVATYTEPAPEGFMPVQSSLPSARFVYADQAGPNPNNAIVARGIDELEARAESSLACPIRKSSKVKTSTSKLSQLSSHRTAKSSTVSTYDTSKTTTKPTKTTKPAISSRTTFDSPRTCKPTGTASSTSTTHKPTSSVSHTSKTSKTKRSKTSRAAQQGSTITSGPQTSILGLCTSYEVIQSTSTLTSTSTTVLTEFTFPSESTTLICDAFCATNKTVTVTSTILLTTYAQTFTAPATTLTAATTTTTVYAACATNNFADVYLPDGQNPANISLLYPRNPRQTYVDTAYDCCAYALSTNASAWVFEGVGFYACGVSYTGPRFSATSPCYSQTNASAQFAIEYRNVTAQTVGNGLCGQISAAYPYP